MMVTAKASSLSSSQPVSTVVDHLDVRVTIIEQSKLPGTCFLLPVLIELRISDDGFFHSVVSQGELLTASQLLFVLGRNRKNYWDRLVGHSIIQKTVEMLALEILSLSHEPSQRSCPAFTKNLE